MFIIIGETDRHSRFDAWDRVLRAGALGWPWGMGWGGRWEGGSGWGTHVHPWLMHVNVWQKPPQYCKVVSLQLKYLKKNQLDRPVCFTHENILLSYVNKTCICSEICLSSRFRSIVLWPGMTHLVPMLSQNNMLWVRGLVSVSEFSDISFL